MVFPNFQRTAKTSFFTLISIPRKVKKAVFALADQNQINFLDFLHETGHYTFKMLGTLTSSNIFSNLMPIV
jgi:hypothetical protein